jgi:hypothetical protein
MFTRLRRFGAAAATLALAATMAATTPAGANEPTNSWTTSAGSGATLRYFDAAAAPNGGVVVAGWIESGGDIDGFVRLIDASGAIAWTTVVGDDAAADWFIAVDVADDGTVFATGNTRGDIGGRMGGTDFDATLVKFSAAGAVQWSRQFGFNGVNRDDRGLAVAASPDGSAFVGASFGGNAKPVVTRYDSAGNQAWLFETGENGDTIEDVAMLGTDAFYSGVRLDNSFQAVEGFLFSMSTSGIFSSETRMPGVTTMRVDTLNEPGNSIIIAGGDDYLATFAFFGLNETPLDTTGRTITDVAVEADGSFLIIDDGSAILRGYGADRSAEPWSRTLAGDAPGARVVATTDGGIFTTSPSGTFDSNNLARFIGSVDDGTVAGFTDVPSGAFFTEAVVWLKNEGITTGTTDTTFSPDDNVTRAQMAAFLWRMVGEPGGNPAHGFTDVPNGTFFAEAVAWLKDQGITTGTSATTYSPNDNVTRAQMAAFLFRMATDSDWIRPSE